MWLDRSLEWRESVVLTAGLFSRKSVERLEIMNGIRGVTKSFELVRADLHLVDGLALTSTSGYSLGVPKGPYVEAVGQVLVADFFEGVVCSGGITATKKIAMVRSPALGGTAWNTGVALGR